jgi:hypothetical protein
MISLGTEALTYPVTLRNISVPNHEQMPERLKELSFEGDQPVTLEFKRVSGSDNFRKLDVAVSNKSNKTVIRMSVQCKYLDADGKALPTWLQSRNPERYPDPTSMKEENCTLGPGMTREIEIGGFGMPETTESASYELRFVEFSDATLWQTSEE